MPGDTTESKPRPAMVSAKVPCTSSQARTQREQTMHFDGIVGEVGVGLVDARDWGASRPRSRSGPRGGRRRRPCPAIRNRRWPSRSGSRADGRRCRAPSRPCGGASAARSGCGRPCRRQPAWCRRPACRSRPSISTRQSRQEPKASTMSVAQSFGILVPISIAARMIEVPSGTVTVRAVDGQRDQLLRPRAGRAVVDLVDERHRRVPPTRRPQGAWAPRRNPRGNGSARSSPDMG